MGLHDAAADVAPPQAEMANPEDATHTAPGLLM
jgi:hypothetical protein